MAKKMKKRYEYRIVQSGAIDAYSKAEAEEFLYETSASGWDYEPLTHIKEIKLMGNLKRKTYK